MPLDGQARVGECVLQGRRVAKDVAVGDPAATATFNAVHRGELIGCFGSQDALIVELERVQKIHRFIGDHAGDDEPPP